MKFLKHYGTGLDAFVVNNPNLISNAEWLARFILHRNDFRKDNTVKPKLFLPYKHVELSVNRCHECTKEEIAKIGCTVAQQRQKCFHGWAEIQAASCRIEPLDVVAAPLDENPNHANVTGFPSKKEDQKSLALKLAASAKNRTHPPQN